jgi:probable phosphoglycerate mutase
LKILRRTNAWKVVQNAPSRFQFPDGESFIGVQTRIVNALEAIIKKHNKPKQIVAVVFHADPIKLAIAITSSAWPAIPVPSPHCMSAKWVRICSR